VRLGLTPAPSHHPSVNGTTDLPMVPPYRLGGLATPDLPPCVPPSLVTASRGTGLVTCCPSPTRRRLGLGPPHPQLISMAAEPSGIRWEGFSPSSRYSCRHSHSPPLQVRFRSPFSARRGRSPTILSPRIRSFGAGLEPRWIVGAAAHSTSELLRTLSRMAASRPTSWLSTRRDYLAHLVRTWGP
jgi:hypothetical protein